MRTRTTALSVASAALHETVFAEELFFDKDLARVLLAAVAAHSRDRALRQTELLRECRRPVDVGNRNAKVSSKT